MVPIATDHLADVADRDILPILLADVLPTGDLFKYQQSDFVAAIEKCRRLRVVRCADDVALQLAPEDVRVATLNARRHRSSHIRKRLVAIEAAQFYMLPIQHESGGSKLRIAEADAGRKFVLRAV